MKKNYKILTQTEKVNLIYDEIESLIEKLESKIGGTISYNFTVERIKDNKKK